MRVFEYAEARSLESRQVLDAAKQLGIDATAPASGLNEEEVTRLDEHFTRPDSGTAGEAASDEDAGTSLVIGDTPAGELGRDELLAELSRERARRAEAERKLAAAGKAAAKLPGTDEAYEQSPKQFKQIRVRVVSGPRAVAFPREGVLVEHCCDESEAIRRLCDRNGMDPTEHRFQADWVGYSKAPPKPPEPPKKPEWTEDTEAAA